MGTTDDLMTLHRQDLQTFLDGVADVAAYPTATIGGLRDVVAGYAPQNPELTSVLRQMASDVVADPHQAARDLRGAGRVPPT